MMASNKRRMDEMLVLPSPLPRFESNCSTDGSRNVLILDVCGVLVSDPMTPLFRRIANTSGISENRVAKIFQMEFRNRLWSGETFEHSFWPSLAERFSVEECTAFSWRTTVLENLQPLPAANHLCDWANRADLWLLSNLRHEWLEPTVEHLRLKHHISHFLISSLTGAVKPAAAAFIQLLNLAREGDRLLYVDDKTANVASCGRLGIDAILADDGKHWMEIVEQWLV